MKKLILLFILLSTISCKPYWYRQHKCRVAQNHIQFEHSRAAKDDPLRSYRNWDSRPKNDNFLFIFKLK